MPAVSKSQRRFMGMVRALQKGDLKVSDLPTGIADKVKKAAKGMSGKDVKKFATTKEKGLPEKKKILKDQLDLSNLSFQGFLIFESQVAHIFDEELTDDEIMGIEQILEACSGMKMKKKAKEEEEKAYMYKVHRKTSGGASGTDVKKTDDKWKHNKDDVYPTLAAAKKAAGWVKGGTTKTKITKHPKNKSVEYEEDSLDRRAKLADKEKLTKHSKNKSVEDKGDSLDRRAKLADKEKQDKTTEDFIRKTLVKDLKQKNVTDTQVRKIAQKVAKVLPKKKFNEKWDTDYKTPENKKGMFKGKTKADLESELAALKKSGPHTKGSKEYTKEKELVFAIRAKSNWK